MAKKRLTMDELAANMKKTLEGKAIVANPTKKAFESNLRKFLKTKRRGSK